MSGESIAQQIRLSIRAPSARGVAERWRSQYQKPDGRWTRTVSGDSEKVYNALCDLGPTPDPEKAAAIIGNKSWTHPRCSGCTEDVTLVVCFDEGWGDDKPQICPSCLAEATRLLNTTIARSPSAIEQRGE